MKSTISKLAITLGILIQAATTVQGFAAQGFVMDQRSFTSVFPREMIDEILSYLSVEQLYEIHESKDLNLKVLKKSAEFLIRKKINKYLGEFILLPEVTAHDVEELRQGLGNFAWGTSITQPIPAFRIAKSKTSVGLYLAVMGHYPALGNAESRTIARWKNNLNLPVTCMTPAENNAFAEKLREVTGRRFRIISNPENEYSIRGRELVDGIPTGRITTSKFFFGDDDDQVVNYGWFDGTIDSVVHPEKIHEVHDNPPGYSHPFGINQAIGNVTSLSADGVLRGGSYISRHEDATSASNTHGFSHFGCDNGFRLVEDL
jgi:hypothetical protein